MAGVVGQQHARAGAASQRVGRQDAGDRCGDRDGVPRAADLADCVLLRTVAGKGVEVHHDADLAPHHGDRPTRLRRR